MALDREWRRRFSNAFDPYRDLTPDECARLYVGRARPPARRIHDALVEGEPARTRIALVGARGSGKSTELRELMHALSKEGSERVPILVDIGEGLPEGASTAAWLPVVAAAIRAAREDCSGAPPQDDPLPQALARIGVANDLLAPLLQAVRVVGPWFGPKGLVAASAAKVGLSWSDAFGRAARAAHEASPPRSALDAVVDAVRAELLALKAAASRDAALLLDGLDKLPSADAVFQALSDAELLYGLPAALVITGPIQLQTDGRSAAWIAPGRFVCEPMYNLPVVDHGGKPKAQGTDVLVELFRRRWEDLGLRPELLPPDLVAQAARWSSGIVREFLHLVRETGREAYRADRERATQADLDQALRDRRHQLEVTMDSERWDILAGVLEGQEPPVERQADLIYQNAVVCYQNDSVWYRPNELLVPFLEARVRRRAHDDG